ncbi:MAG: hypothetical protein LC808_21615, partial [Actinobacteria bacterium]|nr:hypothetical protein [Actinomycetota bacterium]
MRKLGFFISDYAHYAGFVESDLDDVNATWDGAFGLGAWVSRALWTLTAPETAPYLRHAGRGASRSERKSAHMRRFCKPSDGLEPSTHSLPSTLWGNRSQSTATVFAYFCGFAGGPICRRLPLIATPGLHKGSIRRCQRWLRRCYRRCVLV